jgi:hypothetical protein
MTKQQRSTKLLQTYHLLYDPGAAAAFEKCPHRHWGIDVERQHRHGETSRQEAASPPVVLDKLAATTPTKIHNGSAASLPGLPVWPELLMGMALDEFLAMSPTPGTTITSTTTAHHGYGAAPPEWPVWWNLWVGKAWDEVLYAPSAGAGGATPLTTPSISSKRRVCRRLPTHGSNNDGDQENFGYIEYRWGVTFVRKKNTHTHTNCLSPILLYVVGPVGSALTRHNR